MFQGSGTNLKAWNEYTKSKFLDRLKELGSVYCYQDKTYNIWHYDKSNIEHKDYDTDIDIDLSYVKPNTHILMVYNDILKKYKNIKDYKFIPIGFSAGGYLALYFAQVYSSQYINVILLDSSLFTPNNMKARLKMLEKGTDKSDLSDKSDKSFTNTKYKKMLNNWKINNSDVEDAYKISYLNNYIRSLFISKHLKLELPVPTLAFVNMMKPEGDEWSEYFNNKRRLEEVKILKKHNKMSHNYKSIIFINKTHYIFDKIQPAKEIIKQIKNIIKK
jgi:hypothetical protein